MEEISSKRQLSLFRCRLEPDNRQWSLQDRRVLLPLLTVGDCSRQGRRTLVAGQLPGGHGDPAASTLDHRIWSRLKVHPPPRGLFPSEVGCHDDKGVTVWHVEKYHPAGPTRASAGCFEYQAAQAEPQMLRATTSAPDKGAVCPGEQAIELLASSLSHS